MSIELKKLNAQIKSIATKTAKWRDDVQLCLVGCAQHAFDNKNVDPAARLVHAVKGADATAVIRWIEAHMPAIWVQKEAKFRFNKSFNGEYDAIVLMSEAWWELAKKPHQVASTLDCLEVVRALVKRLEKEVKEGTKTVKHAELVAGLSKLANSVEFAKTK